MTGTVPVPSLGRRLACLVYEGVLSFGVVVAVGLAYAALAGLPGTSQGQRGLQLSVFVALGVYFVFQWTRGGQTLAMKTWGLCLVDRRGGSPRLGRAALRYLLAWAWVLPALAVARATDLRGGWVGAALVTGVAAWALAARLRGDRQFLHDACCGTRVVIVPRPPCGVPAS